MKHTILAVDDDPIICAVYESMLDDAYNLLLVASGEEALALLQSGTRPDLILLDIVMPGLDGYEVCRRIRANPLFSHLKLLLVSSKSLAEERVKGYEVGADDYITKPFKEAELLAKIDVFLRLKRTEEINKIKSDFLTLLTHETRTPLNGILGFADLLRHSLNLQQDEKEYVECIIQCGHDLLEFLEKASLLSELKSENFSIHKEMFNIRENLVACEQKFATHSAEKSLVLDIDKKIDTQIYGDPKLLQYAFEAVFENAVQFAQEGTVVKVTLTDTGQRVQVHIANEGEHIPEHHREDIFDEFFVQNLDHHHQGHGLSLAIARRIIRAHDGTLSVKNHQKGPVFMFDMPSWERGRVPEDATDDPVSRTAECLVPVT